MSITPLLTQCQVAALFDEMAEEYDDITDLWFSWLYCRLHYFLVADLASSGIKPGCKCLDVGCGTGFQSTLLSLCGHDVIGIDTAKGLLEKAKRKNLHGALTECFLQTPFAFAPKYTCRIRNLIKRYRGSSPVGKTEFRVASATKLPFPDEAFEIVNCCGSTLSFIEDYSIAIFEMIRVLKRGGLLFLEVENKYNLDIIWPFLDSNLLGGRLGFEQSNEKAATNLFSKRLENVYIDYPMSGKRGKVRMRIRLFSSGKLIREISDAGIAVERIHAIHSVTNVIPSVTLDNAAPNRLLTKLFDILALIEEVMASSTAVRRFGCSLVITGIKR